MLYVVVALSIKAGVGLFSKKKKQAEKEGTYSLDHPYFGMLPAQPKERPTYRFLALETRIHWADGVGLG
jgi:hypothetical protein